MTAHSDRDIRMEAWRIELARLRCNVLNAQERHDDLKRRVNRMLALGSHASAELLEAKRRVAYADLQHAQKALERAGGGRV